MIGSERVRHTLWMIVLVVSLGSGVWQATGGWDDSLIRKKYPDSYSMTYVVSAKNTAAFDLSNVKIRLPIPVASGLGHWVRTVMVEGDTNVEILRDAFLNGAIALPAVDLRPNETKRWSVRVDGRFARQISRVGRLDFQRWLSLERVRPAESSARVRSLSFSRLGVSEQAWDVAVERVFEARRLGIPAQMQLGMNPSQKGASFSPMVFALVDDAWRRLPDEVPASDFQQFANRDLASLDVETPKDPVEKVMTWATDETPETVAQRFFDLTDTPMVELSLGEFALK